jgi:glycosyltransferase involved in cell wall biosynthesis
MVSVIREIASRGFTPLVMVHQTGPLTRYFDEQDIRYTFAPPVRLVNGGSVARQIVDAARAAPHLVAFLKRHAVRIVHTNDARMHFTWGPAARLAQCKFVWHQRSADPSRRLGQYSRLAHAVLTISDYCRRSFAEPMSSRARAIRDPFEPVTSSIDRNAAHQKLAGELGIGLDCVIIGYVGNLTQQKRPLFFVDMAAKVRDRLGANACFAMLGERRPEMIEAVEARIRELGLDRSCFLMGPRYPIEPMIAAFDILAAPAKSEGLGRTLVEAMLLGTPIVAADHAGHREAIIDGETGRLVAADDPEQFAGAIVALMRDHERRETMIRNAKAFAEREFSVEQHLNGLASIYCGMTGVK